MISDRPLDGRRVLLVEDNQLFSSALKLLFEDEGLVLVQTCTNMKAALAAARTEEVDVALLDVNIGGENVFPVAEVLEKRRVPYIFLTGYGGNSLPPSFRNRPAFSKTSAPKAVLEAIAATCHPPDALIQ